MTSREVCRDNLIGALEIEPRHLGDELVGRKQALSSWSELIRKRSFNSIVVEDESALGRRPIAFGASVFVTTSFVDQELNKPCLGLGSRLIQSLSSAHPAVLSDEDMANGSLSKPMDIVMLCGSWLQGELRPEQMREVQTLLPFSFVECHTGYPLNRIINETVTQTQYDFQFSAGVFARVKDYPGHERSLLMMNKESAGKVSGSVAVKLFHYEAPFLALRDTDKQLLSQALNGGDDEQISARVYLAVASVKKRWQSVFDKFESAIPGLFQEMSPERAPNHRGSQKRHHVLAYVRNHPEELRPYRWTADLHR